MSRHCRLERELGSGRYGIVFQTEDKKSAIKAFISDKYNEVISPAEIDILFRLRSPYLLQGEALFNKGVCRRDVLFAIQMNLADGDLQQMSKLPLDYTLRKRLCYDYALSLQVLHHHNYLHLDINANNCFFMGPIDNPRGLLGDYGAASAVQRSSKEELTFRTVQTRFIPSYRDPLIEGKKEKEKKTWVFTYTDRSDLFALAVTFIKIITGKDFVREFEERYDYEVVVKSKDGGYEWESDEQVYRDAFLKILQPKYINDNISSIIGRSADENKDKLTNLLSKMMSLTFSDRPSIDQVLSHPYFSDFKEVVTVEEIPMQTPEYIPYYLLSESDGLHRLLHDFSELTWPDLNMELLMTAVDIFYRSYLILPELDVMIRVTNAYNISLKLFYTRGDIPYSDLGKEVYQVSERELIIGFRGVLRASVYRYAQSAEELLEFLWRLFTGHIRYLRDDLPAKIIEIRRFLSDKLKLVQRDRTVNIHDDLTLLVEGKLKYG